MIPPIRVGQILSGVSTFQRATCEADRWDFHRSCRESGRVRSCSEQSFERIPVGRAQEKLNDAVAARLFEAPLA